MIALTWILTGLFLAIILRIATKKKLRVWEYLLVATMWPFWLCLIVGGMILSIFVALFYLEI